MLWCGPDTHLCTKRPTVDFFARTHQIHSRGPKTHVWGFSEVCIPNRVPNAMWARQACSGHLCTKRFVVELFATNALNQFWMTQNSSLGVFTDLHSGWVFDPLKMNFLGFSIYLFPRSMLGLVLSTGYYQWCGNIHLNWLHVHSHFYQGASSIFFVLVKHYIPADG